VYLLGFISHLGQEDLILMVWFTCTLSQCNANAVESEDFSLATGKRLGWPGKGDRQTNKHSRKDRQPAGWLCGGWYRFLVAIAVATGNRQVPMSMPMPLG